MNRAIAAPDLIDRLPRSSILISGCLLLRGLPTVLSSRTTLSGVMSTTLSSLWRVNTFVVGDPPLRITRLHTSAHAPTGQRVASPERECVRRSIFFPFFWLRKQTVTNWARSQRALSKTLIWRFLESRNVISRISKGVVFPGRLVARNSQPRMAKKKAPQARSMVCLVTSPNDLVVTRISLRKLAVMAGWRFFGGSWASYALRISRTAGVRRT